MTLQTSANTKVYQTILEPVHQCKHACADTYCIHTTYRPTQSSIEPDNDQLGQKWMPGEVMIIMP